MLLPRPVLMLVTEPHPRLPEIVAEAVAGGVNAVQLRDKSADEAALSVMGSRLRIRTQGRALLIVNGDMAAARAAQADGLHLPERAPDGLPMATVRQTIGRDVLVGRSVHSVDSAQRAEAEGADYVLAGTIFASSSHPSAPPAGREFLRAVCAAVTLPVIAIGGIMPHHAPACLQAGAVGIAVLSPLMQAENPCAIAQAYWQALRQSY